METLKKICSAYGCSSYAEQGTTRCEKHRKQSYRDKDNSRKDTPARRYAVSIYSDRRWKQLRKEQLEKQPLCEICLQQGRLRTADTVDHAKGLAQGGAPFDPDNLRSLCNECNSRKSAMDNFKHNETQ